MKGGPVGAGIAAGDLPPGLQRALDDMKDQLLVVLIRRLAGVGKPVVIPVAEVDDTGGVVMEMSVDQAKREFTFQLRRKS